MTVKSTSEFWDVGPFDDELSADWFEDLLESDPRAFFERCLDLTDVDVPHRLACVGVVCTAAVLATLRDRTFPSELPAAVSNWATEHAGLQTHVDGLAAAARDALRQIRLGPSHLRDRWRDAGEEAFERWCESLRSIEAGLA